MHHLFIINPNAGKGRIQSELIVNIKLYCESTEVDYDIEMTKGPFDATHLANTYGEKYQDGLKIFAGGGDGTLHEVLNGILTLKNHTNIFLGVLPIGTGNDFSRNLFSSKDNPLLDIKAQIAADIKPIDVLKVTINNKTIFGINALTIGWDSEVAIDVHKFKKYPFMGGSGAYFFSVFKALSRIKNTRPLDIILDDERIEGNFLLCLCANGSYYGGGFMGAPRAELDDGYLDLVVVKQVPIPKLPKLLINYKNGTHKDPSNAIFHDFLDYKKTKKIQVSSTDLLPITIDGEGQYTSNLSIEVLNKELNFIFL